MEGCVVISLGMFSLPDLPDYDWTADNSDLKGWPAGRSCPINDHTLIRRVDFHVGVTTAA
jgi:hypothetical protein